MKEKIVSLVLSISSLFIFFSNLFAARSESFLLLAVTTIAFFVSLFLTIYVSVYSPCYASLFTEIVLGIFYGPLVIESMKLHFTKYEWLLPVVIGMLVLGIPGYYVSKIDKYPWILKKVDELQCSHRIE